MSIELTLNDLKELLSNNNSPALQKKEISFWEIGKKYLIRTVTMIQIGELIAVSDNELVLRDASWIAETARWYDCLKDGALNEVEPFVADVLVNRNSIIDATEWMHELPTTQK